MLRLEYKPEVLVTLRKCRTMGSTVTMSVRKFGHSAAMETFWKDRIDELTEERVQVS